MATKYANEKLTTAIKNHLLSVDAVPPTTEVFKLTGELAGMDQGSPGAENEKIFPNRVTP